MTKIMTKIIHDSEFCHWDNIPTCISKLTINESTFNPDQVYITTRVIDPQALGDDDNTTILVSRSQIGDMIRDFINHFGNV